MTPRFAEDDADAERRYHRYQDIDPFPNIEPALLNSADIGDYVSATGMILPFVEDSEHLKAASYEVPLLGRYVYWDGQGQEQSDVIDRGDEFILKANSIAFITLEPFFRIPNYIAIRFNLRITNIYRGILLGTGPLVDPGFVGRLSLPLHNLTVNNYPFRGGEGLIWMEFTKISRHPRQRMGGPSRRSPVRRGQFFGIQPYKADPTHDVRYYLQKAWPVGPIRSSITDATLEATSRATEAAAAAEASRREAQRLRNIFTGGGAVALLTLLIGVAAVVMATLDFINGVDTRLDRLSQDLSRLESSAPSSTGVPPTTAPPGDPVVRRPDTSPDLSSRVEALEKSQRDDRRRGVLWFALLALLTVGIGVIIVRTVVLALARPSSLRGPR